MAQKEEEGNEASRPSAFHAEGKNPNMFFAVAIFPMFKRGNNDKFLENNLKVFKLSGTSNLNMCLSLIIMNTDMYNCT